MMKNIREPHALTTEPMPGEPDRRRQNQVDNITRRGYRVQRRNRTKRNIESCGTTVFTSLQQVYCKIPAPAAKIKRPETTLVLPVLVQIERSISLSVLKYNKIHTQSPVPVPGWVSGCACV